MENFEKVEKLREKTGVSYEEAKNALEACNYDLLDAIIYLERQGKVSSPKQESYTTSAAEDTASKEFEQAQTSYEQSCKENSFGEMMNRFFKWCGKVIKKGCDTTFTVTRHDNEFIAVPVIVLVLLLLFAFWIVLPLMVVGLFCNCKYKFKGFESTSIDINDLCDKASDACENLKNDIK